MLQYKRRKHTYLQAYLFPSYTVQRIGIHHVATPHNVDDVKNVLPMVRHYIQHPEILNPI
jgi:hypothetical protein